MASLGRKLSYSALSLVAALGTVEVGLRVKGYDPFGEMIAAGRQEPGALMAKDFLRAVDDDVLVYELAPSASAHAWDADIETNAHGFRDREYALDKPAGTTRIIALGDSATFGVKLPREVLWPERLEASYADHAPPVEVLNLGIVGYDTLEEVAFFEQHGLAFAPDVVLVGYHVNDLGYASPTRDYIERLHSYGAPLYRIRLLQLIRARIDRIEVAREQERRATEEFFVQENARFLTDVSSDSELVALLDALGAEVEATEELQLGSHRYLRWSTSRARVGKLRYALERLAELADEHGFHVALVPIPWLGDAGVESAYDLAYAIARHECERLGFAFVDATQATRAAGHAALRIVEHDFGHPNAEGHALLAGALRRMLDEQGWVR